MYRLIIAAVTTCLLTTDISCDPAYRLDSMIYPDSYSIVITPYFDTGDELAFTFNGLVTIAFETNVTNISKIRLHSKDLEFTADDISISSLNTAIGLNPVNPLEFTDQYSFVDINLETPLNVATRYTMTITYRGPIRADLNGFYRSSYVENGVTKWIGATQMEPTHARKVFPCFDEPEYKAKFQLTVDRPAGFKQSLANTKLINSEELSNGYTRDYFHPSPKMSSYLVAFLVSEFDAAHYATNGSKEFGIFTRPDATNQSDYAFDFGKRVELALSEYFGIDYYSTDPNIKLDHIALPDFSAGAMENWGLVKYRESLILYVPEESTPYYKYRTAQIIAHETTHMWFGDLVTCHWWSNTWLNEGFANYFQDYITALIEPELGSRELLVTGSVYAAYTADETPDAVPINNEDVNSPEEISSHFGTITYQKAGSVIRMMHHLIGDEAFKHGLNVYLETYKYMSSNPPWLFGSLQSGVTEYNSLEAYPNSNVADIMSQWINQPGHPVLHVEVNYESEEVTLTQNRFYLNSTYSSNELYVIPISFTTALNPDFENTKPDFIFSDKTHVFNIANISQEQSWILFNIQETGLYRVNYDSHSWSIISSTLKGEQRETIHNLNRAKIINDVFAFLTADAVDFSLVYDVTEFLSQETDYSVWYAALVGLSGLRTKYFGSETMNDIDAYSLELMDNIINTLGFEVKLDDDFVTLRNRMQILEFACKLGHKGCIDNSVALFEGLKNDGVEITPSLRPVGYCNGLRYGDAEDFDFLWQRMISTNLANEASVIQTALGCSKVEDKLKSYLNVVLEDKSPIRMQDVTVPLASVLADHNNAHLGMEFLQTSNYTELSSVFPSVGTVLSYVAASLHTEEQFTEFESWLSGCAECSESVLKSGQTSLDTSRASTQWADEHESAVRSTLRNDSAKTMPSVLTVVLVAIFMVFENLLLA